MHTHAPLDRSDKFGVARPKYCGKCAPFCPFSSPRHLSFRPFSASFERVTFSYAFAKEYDDSWRKDICFGYPLHMYIRVYWEIMIIIFNVFSSHERCIRSNCIFCTMLSQSGQKCMHVTPKHFIILIAYIELIEEYFKLAFQYVTDICH